MDKPHQLGLRESSREQIERVLDVAEDLEPVARREEHWPILANRILATLFYEPSTRTRLSFETAMLRLGGGVLAVADAVRTSSVWKGETLADTIRTIHSYADVIAIRHSEAGAAAEASRWSNVPILNAGDGTNEHPTQGLLDLLTIRREAGRIDGLYVVVVGDLKHARSINSLVYGLSNFDVRFSLVSPAGFEPIDPVLSKLRTMNRRFELTSDLRGAVRDADVVYVCRIQKERIEDQAEVERILGSYVVDRNLLETARSTPIVMHHLPRVGELSEDVDNYPGARYFHQPWNGVLVRMALLALVLAPGAVSDRMAARQGTVRPETALQLQNSGVGRYARPERRKRPA
jgi:aspartate carbamoyltransferase